MPPTPLAVVKISSKSGKHARYKRSGQSFRTFLVCDAVGEVDPVRHQNALTSMEFLFAKLITTAEVIAGFRTSTRI